MNAIGWIQLALFVAFLFLITKPLGIHLFKVLNPKENPFLHSIFGPLERFFYRVWKVPHG